jgi:hypothetical protein
MLFVAFRRFRILGWPERAMPEIEHSRRESSSNILRFLQLKQQSTLLIVATFSCLRRPLETLNLVSLRSHKPASRFRRLEKCHHLIHPAMSNCQGLQRLVDPSGSHSAVFVSAVGFKKTALLREGLINNLLGSRLV